MVIGKQDSWAFHGSLMLERRRQRHPRRYARALPGLAPDVQPPAKQPDSFFHARVPQAGTRRGGACVKAMPVVVDGKYQPAILRSPASLPQRMRCAWRTTLRSASCATRKTHSETSCGSLLGNGVHVDLDAHIALPRDVLALRLQRLLETQVVEDRRVKTIGQRVNIVAQAHEVIVHGRTLRRDAPQRGPLRPGPRRWQGAPGVASHRRAIRGQAFGARPRVP